MPKKIFIVVAFLFLPFLIAAWLFWYKVELPVTYKKTNGGKVLVRVQRDLFLYPNFKNTIRKIFQTPFDLNYYKLCFRNESGISSSDGVKKFSNADNIIFEDSDDNRLITDSLNIKGGGRGCVDLSLDRVIIDSADVAFNIVEFGKPLKLEINIFPEDKASPTLGDRMASSIIFVLAWWGLILFFLELKGKVWSVWKSGDNKI